ncbi:MAG: hypothetical protein WCK39_06010 [Methanomassiliicoccales archaeon]
MAAHYQIDSCILRSMLDDNDREKNRKTAKHILNSKKYGNLGVSIYAIGEVLGKMTQDREIETCLVAITDLRRMIRDGVLFLRGFGPDEIAFGICMEIMAADQMITPGDA